MAHVLAKGCDGLWVDIASSTSCNGFSLLSDVLVFLKLDVKLVSTQEVDPVCGLAFISLKLVGTLLQALLKHGCDLLFTTFTRHLEQGLSIWTEDHDRWPAVNSK